MWQKTCGMSYFRRLIWKNKMRQILILFFLLFTCAQGFCLEGPKLISDYQQNPSDIKWKYLLTKNFEIIFSKLKNKILKFRIGRNSLLYLTPSLSSLLHPV